MFAKRTQVSRTIIQINLDSEAEASKLLTELIRLLDKQDLYKFPTVCKLSEKLGDLTECDEDEEDEEDDDEPTWGFVSVTEDEYKSLNSVGKRLANDLHIILQKVGELNVFAKVVPPREFDPNPYKLKWYMQIINLTIAKLKAK